MDIDQNTCRPTKNRKPRVVISCSDCRRRKLRCDRQQPCQRCISGGIASLCTYEPYRISAIGRSPTDLSIDECKQHSRPATAASIKKSHNHGVHQTKVPTQGPKTSASDRQPQKTQDHHKSGVISNQEPRVGNVGLTVVNDAHHHSILKGVTKGRGYQTFFYGPSSPVAAVIQFSELRPFLCEIRPPSTATHLSKDLQALAANVRPRNKGYRILQIPSLRDLIPDRAVVDRLLAQYFGTFETTYRIIHRPTFWSQYTKFWDDHGAPNVMNGNMEALVLAVLACTICTSSEGEGQQHPTGSALRTKAITWIKACQFWLRRHSNRHRSLESLQVRCLLVLAHMTTCLKTKEIYQEVQALFAFMKAIGLHRDPDSLDSKYSPFEAEIRRRLWATTMELELQTSIDRGTSSSLYSLDYDCTPPRNINDVDLQPGDNLLSVSQSSNIYTDTSFLHLAAQTLPLRVKLCTVTNQISNQLNFHEILDHGQEIVHALSQIPQWSEPNACQTATLLDLELRQFLLILYSPEAWRKKLGPSVDYARFTSLEASIVLIDKHMELVRFQNYVLCCIRSDYYRAAFTLCNMAYHIDQRPDSLIAVTLKSVFEDAMEKAFCLQEQRALRPGRGIHQYWFVSGAYSLSQVRRDPSQAIKIKEHALDRVSAVYYKILALQENPGEYYLVDEVIINSACSKPSIIGDEIDSSANHSTQLCQTDTTPSDFMELEFGEASAWLFDDYWYDDSFAAT